jgi:hypothetical protein
MVLQWGNVFSLKRIRTVHMIFSHAPQSRVLLEKLTGPQLVKKFPTFYGTRRLITALTTARHLSRSWAISIQSTPPHPTSWRPILILSSHLRLGLPSGLLPSGLPTKTLYAPLPSKTLVLGFPKQNASTFLSSPLHMAAYLPCYYWL